MTVTLSAEEVRLILSLLSRTTVQVTDPDAAQVCAAAASVAAKLTDKKRELVDG